MKCPHCLKEFHAEWTSVAVGNARLGGVIMEGRTSWMRKLPRQVDSSKLDSRG